MILAITQLYFGVVSVVFFVAAMFDLRKGERYRARVELYICIGLSLVVSASFLSGYWP